MYVSHVSTAFVNSLASCTVNVFAELDVCLRRCPRPSMFSLVATCKSEAKEGLNNAKKHVHRVNLSMDEPSGKRTCR